MRVLIRATCLRTLPISAVLSGLLLNVALYAILRCKVLTDGALQSNLAGRLMMGFGLLSVVAAVFFYLTDTILSFLVRFITQVGGLNG